MKLIDITGKTFGELTVIRRAETKWLCRCSCGNEKLIAGYSLLHGHYKSCGCLRVVKRDKGMSEHVTRDKINGTRKSALMAKSHIDNKTGHKGVIFLKDRNKYKAHIGFQGKSIHLGYFDKLEEAIEARRIAEEKYHVPILEKE